MNLPQSTAKPLELSMFKLLVISEKSCFEQKNVWSRFALISLTV